METRQKVTVRLYKNRKQFKLIEVYEDEVEKIRKLNRMTWREEYKEKAEKEKQKNNNARVVSLESLYLGGANIEDHEHLTPEQEMIYEEEREQIEKAEDERAEMLKRLPELLEQLTEKQRDVIKAVFWEGKGFREIAEEQKKDHKTIIENYALGIKKLKKFLEKSKKTPPQI